MGSDARKGIFVLRRQLFNTLVVNMGVQISLGVRRPSGVCKIQMIPIERGMIGHSLLPRQEQQALGRERDGNFCCLVLEP